jgi:hypothetical protein
VCYVRAPTDYSGTEPVDVWIPLKDVECGEIHLRIFYRTFADDLQKSFQAIESTSPLAHISFAALALTTQL